MNANGYGGCFADVVTSVRTITRNGLEEHIWNLTDIAYGNSDSIFMKNGEILIEVTMSLKEDDVEAIKKTMDEYQLSRRTKQPLEKRSAGTMFLRPPGKYVGPMVKACNLMGFSVVNNGNASAKEIMDVLHEVQRRVKEKYQVHLPLDVRMLGEDFPQE